MPPNFWSPAPGPLEFLDTMTLMALPFAAGERMRVRFGCAPEMSSVSAASSLGSRVWGHSNRVSAPRERMRSFFLSKWDVQILYPFNQKPNTPF